MGDSAGSAPTGASQPAPPPSVELDEAREYCTGRRAPSFAALDERARQAKLELLAAQVGLGVLASPVALERGSASALGAQLYQRLAPDLTLSALEQLLLNRFVTSSCESAAVEQLLPETCGTVSADEHRLLAALTRDLLDAASSPRWLASEGSAQLTARLLRAALDGGDVWALIAAFGDCRQGAPSSSAPTPGNSGEAARSAELVGATGVPDDPFRLAGALLNELLRDGAQLDRDPIHYARVAERTLQHPLSDQQQRDLARLIELLRLARSNVRGDTKSLLEALPELAARSTSLASNQPPPDITSAMTLLSYLTEGDRRGLMHGLEQSFVESSTLTPAERAAMTTALRVLQARDANEVEAALKAFVIPPWLGGLIVDAHIGVPVLSVAESEVDFGGQLGWEADRWGFWVEGSQQFYDSGLAGRDLTEAQVNFAGQGWFNWPSLQADVGLTLGAELAYDQYLSQLTVLDATGTVNDDLSKLLRAGAAIGGFWHPTERWFVRLGVTVGLHSEAYSNDLIIANGPDAGSTTTRTDGNSANYRMRGVATFRAIPSWLRLSLLGRARLFQLTRSSTITSFDFGDTFTQQNSVQTTRRTELEARLLFDLEALELGPVRPGLFAAVQYFSTSDGSATIAAIVPVFGAGLVSHLPE